MLETSSRYLLRLKENTEEFRLSYPKKSLFFQIYIMNLYVPRSRRLLICSCEGGGDATIGDGRPTDKS